MPIKFGTDGWRAIIAEDYTFQNVRYCAQATAELMKAQGNGDKALVIGYDTRFASEDFANAVAEVAAANGIKVLLADRACPTPVASYNLVARKAAAGVVITASHNSGIWNGYKVKPHYGGSASPEVVAELEKLIAKVESTGKVNRIPMADATSKKLVEKFDPEPLYLSNIGKLVDLDGIKRSGLKIMVDSMHGAGSGYFKKLVAGGKTQVAEIRADRNPAFPGMVQPEPLEHNLKQLMAEVPAQKASVGVATDGDADRLGIVDEKGNFVTTLQAFALLCYHQLEVLKKRGPLVRSITMTSMVDRLGQIYGVPVFDTPVGFKYLGPIMMKEDALLAGEESGGYAFRGNIPERDGILSGLMILDLMVKTGKSVSDLLKALSDKVGPHYYHRIDLKFDEAKRVDILSKVKAAQPRAVAGRAVSKIDTRDGFRYVLDGGYWSLVRFSGTEPLLRVYAEGESPEQVTKMLEETRALAGV
ncbi:MAG: phosphoglucomutase/phosphomannomutase family protein [SAR202 cluster bacterium]|nr:phosphoglucomutase/phosphomannomutase family protein [SAR202 cluster bacterium]